MNFLFKLAQRHPYTTTHGRKQHSKQLVTFPCTLLGLWFFFYINIFTSVVHVDTNFCRQPQNGATFFVWGGLKIIEISTRYQILSYETLIVEIEQLCDRKLNYLNFFDLTKKFHWNLSCFARRIPHNIKLTLKFFVILLSHSLTLKK